MVMALEVMSGVREVPKVQEAVVKGMAVVMTETVVVVTAKALLGRKPQ